MQASRNLSKNRFILGYLLVNVAEVEKLKTLYYTGFCFKNLSFIFSGCLVSNVTTPLEWPLRYNALCTYTSIVLTCLGLES